MQKGKSINHITKHYQNLVDTQNARFIERVINDQLIENPIQFESIQDIWIQDFASKIARSMTQRIEDTLIRARDTLGEPVSFHQIQGYFRDLTQNKHGDTLNQLIADKLHTLKLKSDQVTQQEIRGFAQECNFTIYKWVFENMKDALQNSE